MTNRFDRATFSLMQVMFICSTVCAVEFQPLPTDFRPSGISANGSIIVGNQILGPTSNAIRWSSEDGLSSLSSDAISSWANAVSGDGSTIVGSLNADPSAQIWTKDVGWQSLDMGDSGIQPREAIAVSNDATVILGVGEDFSRFLWSEDRMLLPVPPGSVLSGNGNVVAGTDRDLFVWSEEDGQNPIPGTNGASVLAISNDGSVVGGVKRGYAEDTSAVTPFYWSEDSDVQLFPFDFGKVTSISGDGSKIVGDFSYADGSSNFIWERGDWRSLSSVLQQDYGIELPGWELGTDTLISGDGLVFAGLGTNPNGERQTWVLSVPEPCAPAHERIVFFCALFVWRSRNERQR